MLQIRQRFKWSIWYFRNCGGETVRHS